MTNYTKKTHKQKTNKLISQKMTGQLLCFKILHVNLCRWILFEERLNNKARPKTSHHKITQVFSVELYFSKRISQLPICTKPGSNLFTSYPIATQYVSLLSGYDSKSFCISLSQCTAVCSIHLAFKFNFTYPSRARHPY